MPNLSPKEIAALDKGICPDCGKLGFRLGPTGGVAINIQCVTCDHWFNVVRHLNQTLFAERINR